MYPLRAPTTSFCYPRASRAGRRCAASPSLAGRAALVLLQSSLLPTFCFHAASSAPPVRIHRPRSVPFAGPHFHAPRRRQPASQGLASAQKMPPLGATKASQKSLGETQKEWVWYASYGSNMWEDRFLCYIRGGQVEGMSKACGGCRDPSPPARSTWVQAPHRTWFGRTRTAMWGSGGVCFLDPLPSPPEDPHYTLLRLHKISLEQFNDVVAQENSMHFSGMRPADGALRIQQHSSASDAAQTSSAASAAPPALEPLVPAELIEKLRNPPAGLVHPADAAAARAAERNESTAAAKWVQNGAAAHRPWEAEHLPHLHRKAPEAEYRLNHLAWPAFHEVIQGGWYGTVVYLGDLEGWPILTFTSNLEDTRKFHAGKLPVQPPSPSYRKVVAAGLMRSGLDAKQTELYIDQRSKPLQTRPKGTEE